MKFLLKLFKTETLWREVIKREHFTIADEVESVSIWTQVFYKVPELSDYLKRREIKLLQSSTLREKPNEFILGQISENRLIRAYDTPNKALLRTDIEKVEKKIMSQEDFLKKWENKQDANKDKADEQSGGVSRSEA